MKPDRSCQFPGCGLVRSAGVHAGAGPDKHEYAPPKRDGGFGQQRQALKPRSERPNRVERHEESQRAMAEHRAAVRYCEAPEYGFDGECWGPLAQHHIIGRGAGGGKDYQLLATLCQRHHERVDTDRQKARDVGLSMRPPTTAVPRREAAQEPPVPSERPSSGSVRPWSRFPR